MERLLTNGRDLPAPRRPPPLPRHSLALRPLYHPPPLQPQLQQPQQAQHEQVRQLPPAQYLLPPHPIPAPQLQQAQHEQPHQLPPSNYIQPLHPNFAPQPGQGHLPLPHLPPHHAQFLPPPVPYQYYPPPHPHLQPPYQPQPPVYLYQQQQQQQAYPPPHLAWYATPPGYPQEYPYPQHPPYVQPQFGGPAYIAPHPTPMWWGQDHQPPMPPYLQQPVYHPQPPYPPPPQYPGVWVQPEPGALGYPAAPPQLHPPPPPQSHPMPGIPPPEPSNQVPATLTPPQTQRNEPETQENGSLPPPAHEPVLPQPPEPPTSSLRRGEEGRGTRAPPDERYFSDPDEPGFSGARERRRRRGGPLMSSAAAVRAEQESSRQELQKKRAERRKRALERASDEVWDDVDEEEHAGRPLSPHSRRRWSDNYQRVNHRRNRMLGGRPGGLVPGFDPSKHYRLRREHEDESVLHELKKKRFRIEPVDIGLQTRTYSELSGKMMSIMEHALRRVMAEVEDLDSQARITITNPGLHTGGVSSTFRSLAEVRLQEPLTTLEAALNSDETLEISETTFELLIIPPEPAAMRARREHRYQGQGDQRQAWRRNRQLVSGSLPRIGARYQPGISARGEADVVKWLDSRKSVVDSYRLTPESLRRRCNLENLCIPLTLVDARKLHLDGAWTEREKETWVASRDRVDEVVDLVIETFWEDALHYKAVAMEAETAQARSEAEKEVERLMVGPYDELEAARLAQTLLDHCPGLRISFFNRQGPPIQTVGDDADDPVFIDILLHQSHAYLLKKLHVFMGGRKVCRLCYQSHLCGLASCTYCLNNQCQQYGEARRVKDLECPNCLTHFLLDNCLQAHAADGDCTKHYRCEFCFQKDTKEHNVNTCRPPLCSTCKQQHTAFQDCFVSGDKKDQEAIDKYALDILTDTPITNRRPNAEMDNMWTMDFESQISPTGKHIPVLLVLYRRSQSDPISEEVHKFLGTDCVEQFLDMAIQPKSIFKGSTIMAHNGSRYDALLFAQGLIRLGLVPNVLMRGTGQILSLDYKPAHVKLRDSYLHIPIPLRHIPKAFGIEDAQKGFFPYLIDSLKYINGGGSGEEGRELETEGLPELSLFDADNMKGAGREELLSWWTAEDARLRQSGQRYNVVENLVSYCVNDASVLYSALEKYVEEVSSQYPGIDIFSSLTSSSFSNRILRDFYLYAERESMGILEPNGLGRQNHSPESLAWLFFRRVQDKLAWFSCYRHGCTKCFPWGGGRTAKMEESYLDTVKTEERLREAGRHSVYVHGAFAVVTVWACDFKREYEADEEKHELYLRYIRTLNQKPLSLRDALYGGRTEVFRHQVDCAQLAPPIAEWFGFVLGKLYPPRDLHVGVVPYRTKSGRLTFPLCARCAEEADGEEGAPSEGCPHSDEERALRGTWCTEEFVHALRSGYTCGGVDELWHWPARSKNIFHTFITSQFASFLSHPLPC